jgi:hypothetical protein
VITHWTVDHATVGSVIAYFRKAFSGAGYQLVSTSDLAPGSELVFQTSGGRTGFVQVTPVGGTTNAGLVIRFALPATAHS